MPKHKKRKFKTKEGIQRRINIKNRNMEQKKRKQEKQYQQSF